MEFGRPIALTLAALIGTIPAPASFAADIETVPIRAGGIVGELHYPSTAHHATAVIMLNGSDGGTPSAKDADDLARSGYTVLALAYFKDDRGQPEGLPASLNDIPLEYFFHAIDWLKARPEVDRSRIVLMGQSRGAELALLLGSIRRDVASVIAFSPSSHVWQGIPPRGSTEMRPAWTLGGKPVPYQLNAFDPKLPTREWFARATPIEAARIHVEDIHGPVMLVSSKTDGLWPATAYADEIAATIAAHHPDHPVTNLQFDDASHLLMGTGPGMTKFQIPGTTTTFDFGGTPQGNARARAKAWAAAKNFIAAM